MAFVTALATGCALIVDTSDLDRGCAPDEKKCDDRCVLKLDPAYGCGDGCGQPCTIDHAMPGCDALGQCTVEQCLFGFECKVPGKDGGTASGCFDLDYDSTHCGSCDHACPSGQSCLKRMCVSQSCADGGCVAQ